MPESCMLPSKLKHHLETNHPNMAGKFRDYFNRKIRELKEQKVQVRVTISAVY
jgi:hypothetical protein